MRFLGTKNPATGGVRFALGLGRKLLCVAHDVNRTAMVEVGQTIRMARGILAAASVVAGRERRMERMVSLGRTGN